MVADKRPKRETDEGEGRERVAAMLTGRSDIDAREAKYRQLVAQYGGNRRARRRARAEIRKRGAAG